MIQTQSPPIMPINVMQSSHQHDKKRWAYFVSGLLLLLAALLFWMRIVSADVISYDPYADSVASSSTTVVNPLNAVGAPDGNSAQLVGADVAITLDMGAGEEGTQTLRLHLGQISVQANVTVTFLDSGQSTITSETRTLNVNPDPSTQNFAYNWASFNKAYRFVRVSSAAGAGVNVDAVEALGFIGSTVTQDTDGDGQTDRVEQQNGTDPLVFNQLGGSGSGGGSTAKKTSGQVNSPPAANNDKDGDGMADDWEKAHGLNPADASDAKGDPDKDGLTNLTEYQINSDPQKADTDGDGMPDGWEYDHGLNVLVNDAVEDPDGDYLTNLGEYKNSTDPNKADDLHDVFGSKCAVTSNKVSTWSWLVFVLLVTGALVALLKAMTVGPMDPPTSSSGPWHRFKYRLHKKLHRG